MAFLGSVSANRSASDCKTCWLLRIGLLAQADASAPGASVSASFRAWQPADPVVVAMAVLGRPLQGEVRIDPAMSWMH